MFILRFRFIAVVIVVFALTPGCARPASEEARSTAAGGAAAGVSAGYYSGPMAAEMQKAAMPRASGPPSAQDSAEANAPATPTAATFAAMADSQPDRFLIRNATITVEAANVRKATDDLVRAVRAAKGYVSDMHEQADGIGGLTATMQVRVPYPVFDQSMQQLASLGKVLEKQVTAEDVTEEFVDTQAKVRNLKRTEARLLDHLGRTGKLSDTLLIEKELTRVRQEVEQFEGRVRFLSHRIAFSTITVTLRQTAAVQALAPAESYSAAKEGSAAVRSLVEFGRSVLSLLIWVGVWVPVWLPIAYILFVLIRRHRATQAPMPPRTPYSPYPVPPQPPSAPPPAPPSPTTV